MTAAVLDGKALAAAIRDETTRRAAAVESKTGRKPSLAAVLVGEDPASVAYARMKGRWAERCGIGYGLSHVPLDGGESRVLERLAELNADVSVDGILVEMPLPEGYDPLAVQASIAPAKDVEGISPANLGRLLASTPGPRPATAVAIVSLLKDAGVPIEGREAVVVGRSLVVGKPTAVLLLAENATVTVAHTRTRDLAAVCRRADILVGAAGSPFLLGRDHVRPGAAVIDAGTTLVGEGDDARLRGDADYDALLDVASAITPVPGGVGPVTTAILLRTAAELAEGRA